MEIESAGAPMAKLLSILLILGQCILAIAFVLFLLTAFILVLPHDTQGGFLPEMPETLDYGNMLGSCLAGAVVAAGWFFALNILQNVVKAIIHGDPFLPKNISLLRKVLVIIILTEIARMVAIFLFGSTAGGAVDNTALRLDIRLGTWFLIFIIAAISEAFRHGAALRAEQELTI